MTTSQTEYDQILASMEKALAGRKPNDVNALELLLAVRDATPDVSPDKILAVVRFSARQIFRDAVAYVEARR